MSEPTTDTRRGPRRGVYVLPTLLTVGNIFCGFVAIDSAHAGRFVEAAMLLFLAGVLDGLDGRIARLMGATSAFGEQLDSLSDAISFGLAPAVLVYLFALQPFGRWGLITSFLFLVCGVCRLARFNVQAHTVDKRYFVGLPIPAAAGALVGPIWVLGAPPTSLEMRAGFLALTVVLSYFMVSTIRYRSFKDVDMRAKRSPLLVPVLAVILALLIGLREVALTGLIAVFALSGPVAKVASVVFRRKTGT